MVGTCLIMSCRSGAVVLLIEWIGLDWVGLDWVGLDWVGKGLGLGVF